MMDANSTKVLVYTETKLPTRRDYRRRRAKKRCGRRNALIETQQNVISIKRDPTQRHKAETTMQPEEEPPPAWTLLRSIRGAAAALVALKVPTTLDDNDNAEEDDILLSLVDTFGAPGIST